MMHPGDLISRTGEMLMGGHLEAMASAHCYPFVVSMGKTQHVVREPEETVAIMGALREALKEQGVVSAESKVQSHIIFNDDMAFLSSRTVYRDADGREVTDSKCSYVLCANGDRWEIITVSIDKKALQDPRACLLEQQAA